MFCTIGPRLTVLDPPNALRRSCWNGRRARALSEKAAIAREPGGKRLSLHAVGGDPRRADIGDGRRLLDSGGGTGSCAGPRREPGSGRAVHFNCLRRGNTVRIVFTPLRSKSWCRARQSGRARRNAGHAGDRGGWIDCGGSAECNVDGRGLWRDGPGEHASSRAADTSVADQSRALAAPDRCAAGGNAGRPGDAAADAAMGMARGSRRANGACAGARRRARSGAPIMGPGSMPRALRCRQGCSRRFACSSTCRHCGGCPLRASSIRVCSCASSSS